MTVKEVHTQMGNSGVVTIMLVLLGPSSLLTFNNDLWALIFN